MRIRREHSLGIEEARRKVDEIAADMGGRLNLSSEWHENDLQIDHMNGSDKGLRWHLIAVVRLRKSQHGQIGQGAVLD